MPSSDTPVNRLKIYPITPLTSQLVLEARLSPTFKSGPSTLVYFSVRSGASHVGQRNSAHCTLHSLDFGFVIPWICPTLMTLIRTAEISNPRSARDVASIQSRRTAEQGYWPPTECPLCSTKGFEMSAFICAGAASGTASQNQLLTLNRVVNFWFLPDRRFTGKLPVKKFNRYKPVK